MLESISINNYPNCGFGNKILYYFNLRQISYKFNIPFHSVNFDGLELFEENMTGNYNISNPLMLNFCLGEMFFETELPTRAVFKIKKELLPKELIEKNKKCAIHFRGTDFFTWNKDSILSSEYYINSIKSIIEDNPKVEFIIFTDDNSLKAYKDTINYLNSINYNYSYGENTSNRKNFKKDFISMCLCDYIISSPSTFCITAGFIGKDKKIIHSKNWVEDRAFKKDKFWEILYNTGGNTNYKIWKVV